MINKYIKPIITKKWWRGFAPMYFPMSTKTCAYYHCTEERDDGRRFCKNHAELYDQEALAGQCKVLPFG